jgi:hypothetical protein
MLFYLVFGVVYEGFTLRRLRPLIALPPSELLSRFRSPEIIPWSRISTGSFEGNLLRFKVPGRKPGTVHLNLERDSRERTLDLFKQGMGERLTMKHRGRLALWLASLPSMTVLLLALGVGLSVAASVLPFFPGEQAHYAALLASAKAQLSGASPFGSFVLIFLNNVQIALSSAIPGLGQVVYFISSYNTGRVLQVIAIQDNASPSSLVLSLFALPHTWVEEFSYAVAGGLLLQASLRTFYLGSATPLSEQLLDWTRRPSVQLALGFAKVAGMLVAAAFLETIEPYLGVGALLLWVPVLGFAVWYLRGRLRQDKLGEDGEETHIQPIGGT